MATQTYVNSTTLSDATEFNRFDTVAYSVLSGVAGTDTITATGPANYTYSATTPPVTFIPAATNTAATTINITPSGGAAGGAKDIFWNGAACTGGELKIGVPATIVYDGTQFNIINSTLPTALTLTRIGLGQAADSTKPLAITNATSAQYCAGFAQTHATQPLGIVIGFTGTPNGTGNQFIECDDNNNGVRKAAILSNGGLSNFSANNVNLSDARVKPVVEALKDAGLMPALRAAYKRVEWVRFKYDDQSHDDWNYGYIAQQIRDAFIEVVPALVEQWDAERSDLLAVYSEDLKNIAMALLSWEMERTDNLVSLLVSNRIITQAEADTL